MIMFRRKYRAVSIPEAERVNEVQRPSIGGLIPEILPKQVFNETSIVQIDGCFATGKSILLLEIVARCILDVELGGRGGDVVYFDVNCQLDINRLTTTIVARINCSSHDTKDILVRCLGRLKVIRVWTIDQFLLNLYKLENDLNEFDNVSLVCIDGVISFYWLARHQAQSPCANKCPFFVKLGKVISRISRTARVPFVITRQLLFQNQMQPLPATANAQTSDYMGEQWYKLITLRYGMLDTQLPDTKSIKVEYKDSETMVYMKIAQVLDFLAEAQSDGMM